MKITHIVECLGRLLAETGVVEGAVLQLSERDFNYLVGNNRTIEYGCRTASLTSFTAAGNIHVCPWSTSEPRISMATIPNRYDADGGDV